MATIHYQCDTCKREIELLENPRGLTVFAKCVITLGCKGKLHKLSRNPDNIRSVFPPSVQGLNNYLPRRVFFEHNQNILSNKWNINHRLGVSPSVVVYVRDEITGVASEVSPDFYVITVVDENSITLEFDNAVRGIVHLIARSSVPRDFDAVVDPSDLFQVSTNSLFTLALPRLLTTPNEIDLLTHPISVKIITTIPGRDSEESIVPLSLSLDDSPWIGWTEVLIRKRRHFVTRTLKIEDIEAFDEFASISLVPNGTSIQFTQIDFGDGLQLIQSRQLFALLSKAPFEPVDKIRNQIVDLGNLNISRENRLFLFDDEALVDTSNIENIYPKIQQHTSTTLFILSPTPTPTPTVTPTVTPSFTPTPEATQTPTVTPTAELTPTVTPTPSITPTLTPTVTATLSPTPTPTLTVDASLTPTPTITPTHTVTPTITQSPTVEDSALQLELQGPLG